MRVLRGAQFSRQDIDHWIHIEESPRQVRVVFAGETVAESKRVMLLREAKCLPAYYFPRTDVRLDRLVPSEHKTRCPYKGEASYWSLRSGSQIANQAVWSYLNPTPECMDLKHYMSFIWDEMDAWYEEDEQIFRHARDPYKRVDVLQSTRHVQVIVSGEVVADSRRPRLLFETGHPVRYYLPKEDIRMDLLQPSTTSTRCPYKGVASYWSVKIGSQIFEDLTWSYLDPIPECPKIKGLLCFFNERVGAIFVDGEKIPVPQTSWSDVSRLKAASR
jgi:uncharacterized protein (DUF427 family)